MIARLLYRCSHGCGRTREIIIDRNKVPKPWPPVFPSDAGCCEFCLSGRYLPVELFHHKEPAVNDKDLSAIVIESGSRWSEEHETVKHYTLMYHGRFVGSTTIDRDADMFREIAEKLNQP